MQAHNGSSKQTHLSEINAPSQFDIMNHGHEACDHSAEGSEMIEVDPLSDPEERKVLFAALDSYR